MIKWMYGAMPLPVFFHPSLPEEVAVTDIERFADLYIATDMVQLPK